MKKLTLTIALVVAAVGIAGGAYVWQKEPNPATPPPQISANQQTAPAEISYEGADGQSALDLLKKAYKTETKNYKGVGEMVTSIDGRAADNKHFWAFYINGQQAQVGAGSYATKTGEKITWKLEEIQ